MRISFALLALMAWLPVTADAGLLMSLTPNGEDEGGLLEVGLSETGAVSVYVEMGADDTNLSFVIAFFDATPLRDSDAIGYDVVGREFKMQRNDGSGWFRAIEWNGDRSIEQYALLAADDDRGFPHEQWGTDGPWEGVVDSIIIHGTEVGDYDLYFENPWTVEPGHAARSPGLFSRDNGQYVYSITESNCHLPGHFCFRNAWFEGTPGFEFDVPFLIWVTPEPASILLLGVGMLSIAWRRGRGG